MLLLTWFRQPHRLRRWSLWGCCTALLLACDSDVFCVGYRDETVIVTVVDSRTGQPAADNASGIVVGTFRGTTIEEPLAPARRRDGVVISLGANVPPGEYEVHVERTGFEPWMGRAVVEGVGCSAEPVTLVAELVPVLVTRRLFTPGPRVG